MHLHVAGFMSFCVVLWHWCDGQQIPSELQKYNISPPNRFGRESPTNKTIDQLITEAMAGLKGALNRKSKNGAILVELDMVLSEEQYKSLYEQPNSNTLIRSKRKAIRDPFWRWTNGEIPYRFNAGHFSEFDQYMVRQAMTEWERYTCLRFREATSSDKNVIVFRTGGDCSSYVGMMRGVQFVNLTSAEYCRNTRGYLHEIGHAIGLVHEHNRPDRDIYVTIVKDNIEDTVWKQNFQKYSPQDVDQMNVSYDYSSIMHYDAYANTLDKYVKILWENEDLDTWGNFIISHDVDQMSVPYDYSYIMHYDAYAGSKNGKETIRVKFPEKGASIGLSKILSFADVEIVNKMYRCHAKCDPSIKCSGGYVDENCRCICKNGFQDCQIGGGIKPSGNACGVNTNGDSWKCFVLAQQGECEANSTFRNKECARACGPCGLKRKPGTCVKMYPSDKCLKWSRNGDCKNNSEWMNNYCCGTCANSNDGSECKNLHSDTRVCDIWAKAGYCKTNQFVTINCAKSCGNCSDQGPSTSSNVRLANTIVKTTTEKPLINKVNEQAPADDPNGVCRDENDSCLTWARYGFCKLNRDEAVRLCPKTCSLCDQRQWLLLQ